MDSNDHDIPIALPAELRRQFELLETRLWRAESTVAFCRMAGGAALSFLAFFVSERLWDTPVWLRSLLLAAGLGASATAFWLWARNWLLRRRDLRAMAALVQKAHRRLGDRLLGIVELAGEHQHLPNFSPQLYQAAIEQVAEEAKGCDFRRGVDLRPAVRLSIGAGLLILLVLALSMALPQAMGNAFVRWIAPASSTPRYTLVALGGLPARLIVPQGERFVVAARVDYRAFWRPRQASARLRGQPDIQAEVESSRMQFEIPPQTDEGALVIRLGDTSARVVIEPRYRPSLKELAASITLPEYLTYPIQTQAVRNGMLLITEGSRVAFQGKISRPIRAAAMRDAANADVPLNVHGELFASPSAPVDGMAQFSVNWRDDLDLTNAAPLRLVVQTQKDAPPTVDLPDLPRESILLSAAVLPVRVAARDDFGVWDFGLTWQVFSDVPQARHPMSTEVKVQSASTHEISAENTFDWSPSVFRVPPDSVVEIQAYARDYLPGRQPVVSPVYRIQVLSPAKHAEILRQALEATMERAEEIARAEEKVLNATMQLTNLSFMSDAQKTARIAQAKEDQKQTAANLEQLARQGTDIMKEAIKNPMISTEAVRQFSSTMQQWQKLAQTKMSQASKSLESAQKSPQSRQQDLADAAQKEQESLDELSKQMSKSNDNMNQLQAQTFAQRLHHLGDQETEAGDQLVASATDSIGLMPGETSAKTKEFQSSIVKGQESIQNEADLLVREIDRFIERVFKAEEKGSSPVRGTVPKTNYATVKLEMKEAQIPENLETLKKAVQDNILLESSSALTNWSRRLHEWGARLEPKSEEGGKNSGQNGANANAEQKQLNLAKQLIALIRLREEQLALRERTLALDRRKEADYANQAGLMALEQMSLQNVLQAIHNDTKLEQLDPAFAEGAEAMNRAAVLLDKPQTGPEPQQQETAAADALSDLVNLINEQAQKNKPKSQSQSQSQEQQSEASAEEMSFLTQMMKEQDQQREARSATPGFPGQRGGTAGRLGGPASTPGAGTGRAATQRTVNKAAGVLENSPAEFRQALEDYFHAIENK